MGEPRLHLYLWGEAYDDLRAAFYVDEREYADAALGGAAVEAAEAAMSRLGVIYSVETVTDPGAVPLDGVPTWEQFKQRHFVEGKPLDVRAVPRDFVVPPSWDAMNEAVAADHRRFRDELWRLLTEAFPGGHIEIEADHGALRRSPASVDWSEERYGFEIALRVDIRGTDPGDGLDRLTDVLRGQGWECGDQHPGSSGAVVEATHNGYRLWVNVRSEHVVVRGESPLYRAPAEPGTTFVTEPRRPKS